MITWAKHVVIWGEAIEHESSILSASIFLKPGLPPGFFIHEFVNKHFSYRSFLLQDCLQQNFTCIDRA